MRIGIDGIPLGAAKTGIGHYVFELAHELAQLVPSIEFELVAPAPPDEVQLEQALLPNLHKIRVPVSPMRQHWWTIGLPLYIGRRSLSLFHGTNYNIPLWNRCPSIVTIHDLSLLLHSETHEPHLVERARLRLPTMVRSASKIITDSMSVKREICEHFRVAPEKIAVVPLAPRRAFRPIAAHAVAETHRRLGIEPDFLLFVGTVEPRKNLLTLVRAFAELLRTSDLHPQLVIAGQKGWRMDEFFAFVENSAVKGRIHFTGYITDEDLATLYSSCRAFIYPSLYEGFGLPPLEAMACGAPVITSRIPVIMETVGDSARLFAPTDVQSLAQNIRELWTDEKARAHLSNKGLARAAEFTWERTARLTLGVYDEVLQASGRRPIVSSTCEGYCL